MNLYFLAYFKTGFVSIVRNGHTMTIKMRYENGRALPLYNIYNPFNPNLMSAPNCNNPKSLSNSV